MKVLGCVVLGLLGIAGPALAAPPQPKNLSLESVNDADPSTKEEHGISPSLIKAEVLLDRARFSPGVIDGHDGENVHNAFSAFEKAHNLKVDGKLDDEVWAKLNEGSSEPVLTEYTITEDDVKGPFVQKMPEKFEDLAKLD